MYVVVLDGKQTLVISHGQIHSHRGDRMFCGCMSETIEQPSSSSKTNGH